MKHFGKMTDSQLVKALKTKAVTIYGELPSDIAKDISAFLRAAARRIEEFEGVPVDFADNSETKLLPKD